MKRPLMLQLSITERKFYALRPLCSTDCKPTKESEAIVPAITVRSGQAGITEARPYIFGAQPEIAVPQGQANPFTFRGRLTFGGKLRRDSQRTACVAPRAPRDLDAWWRTSIQPLACS